MYDDFGPEELELLELLDHEEAEAEWQNQKLRVIGVPGTLTSYAPGFWER